MEINQAIDLVICSEQKSWIRDVVTARTQTNEELLKSSFGEHYEGTVQKLLYNAPEVVLDSIQQQYDEKNKRERDIAARKMENAHNQGLF